MRLTVLGSAGTHPSADRMCACYLVEHDGFRLLLDCGNGALSNLQKVLPVAELDAVLISHLHPDHFADVYGLYYALRFFPGGPASVPLVGPEGTQEFINRLLPPESSATFAARLPLTVAAAGDTLTLGPFTVTLFPAVHPIETLASRIEAGGRVLAYTGDTAPGDALVACARGADLLLADASWREADRPHPEGVHMTGAEAGRLAAAAGAARLMCTHVYPTNDAEEMAEEARGAFGGEVLVAHDLDVVELP